MGPSIGDASENQFETAGISMIILIVSRKLRREDCDVPPVSLPPTAPHVVSSRYGNGFYANPTGGAASSPGSETCGIVHLNGIQDRCHLTSHIERMERDNHKFVNRQKVKWFGHSLDILDFCGLRNLSEIRYIRGNYYRFVLWEPKILSDIISEFYCILFRDENSSWSG